MTPVLAMLVSSRGSTDDLIEVPFGDFTFGAKPAICETLGVANAPLEDTDDIWPAADMRMHQRVDELGRARLTFGVEIVECGFEALEINPRGILWVKDQRVIVGVVQARHDDQRLAVDHAVLGYVRAEKIAAPVDAFFNEVDESMFVDSMARSEPAEGALEPRRREVLQGI